jgi:hypothetical protein
MSVPELADLRACIEAVVFAGQSLKDNPNQIWAGRDLRVEVADEDRRATSAFVGSRAVAHNERAIAQIQGLAMIPKKRRISRLASGPPLMVYEPKVLPPNQA